MKSNFKLNFCIEKINAVYTQQHFTLQKSTSKIMFVKTKKKKKNQERAQRNSSNRLRKRFLLCSKVFREKSLQYEETTKICKIFTIKLAYLWLKNFSIIIKNILYMDIEFY